MKFLNRLGSRIIYPSASADKDFKDSLIYSEDSIISTSLQPSSASKRWRPLLNLKRLIYARFRLRSNITVPLPALLILPVLVILLFILLISILRGGDGNHLLPSVNGPPPIREISGSKDKPFVLGCVEPDTKGPRANAVLVVLARNSEIEGVVDSMRSLERHWNRWFHYPYVFLNDEPFNSTFKEIIMNTTESKVQFGTVSQKDWNFPEWADPSEIDESIAMQGDRAIMYGGMASYHKMCRFYSGAFFKHPLLAPYDWYWRVEPDVKYFCDITYDPFLYMQRNNKVYGFTIIIKELVETVPNLFRHAAGFKNERNITSKGMWELFLKKPDPNIGDAVGDSGSVRKKKIQDKILENQRKEETRERLKEKLPEEAMVMDDTDPSNDYSPYKDYANPAHADRPDYFSKPVHPEAIRGETYNMCHFWSNFEIARLDFFRSKEYEDFFETLDRSGGFWSERWGDAPVHSLAAGLFLSPEQVHYFRDIGYRHTTIQHCPANAPERQLPRTPYIPDPNSRHDIDEDNYWADFDAETTNGVGCRCKCDTDVVEVEGKEGSCLSDWVDLVGGWV